MRVVIDRKRLGRWLAGVSVVAIAVATLTPVSGGVPATATRAFCVICHERAYADFVSNVILFAPLGLSIALLGGRMPHAAVAGLLFSATIEMLQIQVVGGRDANLGDLLANGAGAVAGWFLGRTAGWWLPRSEGSALRSLGMTAVIAIMLLAGLTLFRQDFPERAWFLQWTPALGGLAHYEGKVLASRLGELQLGGPGPLERSDSVRTLLFAPHWTVDLIAGPRPDRIAPIVSIYDGRGKEMMLLGAYGDDLVYRQRLRAATRRFDAADLRISDVFASVRPGDTVQLEYRADAASQCARVAGYERCTRGYTVGDTWSLLMFPDSWGPTMQAAMATAWLSGLFGLVGFLAVAPRVLATAAAATAFVLVAGPPLLGFAITPLFQLAAALGGLGCGFAAATLLASLRARRPQPVAAGE